MTTSWIFGAAFAACSDRCAALSERASAAWAASAAASGAPCRSARLSAATSCGMPVAGARASSRVERLLGGLAHARAVGGALELLREHAGVAPADLAAARAAARARRRSPPASGPGRRAARPPSPSPARGRERAARIRERGSRATGAASRSARPSRPGRERGDRERGQRSTISASPACSATISLVGRSIPAAATRARQAAGGVDAELRAELGDGAQGRAGDAERRRSMSVSPAAAATAARVARRTSRRGRRGRRRRAAAPEGAPAELRDTQRRWTHPRHRTTLRVRRRTATSAMSCSSSARQVSQAEIGFVSRPLQQAGLGELGEDGRADRAGRARSAR